MRFRILDDLLEQVDKNWIALLAVLGLTLLVYAVARALLGRAFAAARRRQEGREGAERTLAYLRDLERWVRTAVLLLVLLGGLVGFLGTLGIALPSLVTPTIDWLRDKGLRVLLILFLAFLARRSLRFLVGQLAVYLRRRGERTRDEEVRLKTVSDVLLGGGSVVIAVVGTFLVLETVLQSVGTVLASAGFLGIAVGFGAQSLVRDLISGFFILLENQYAIGDAVRINDLWGSVERIGLRCTVLRDGEGIAHIIPNGSITRVSNATKGWSRAMVQVGTDYTVDPDKVLSVLAQVAREMKADPAWAGALQGELEAKGPESFEDSVIYRVAGPTLPTRQWEVMRELRLRVWKAFAREGIPLKKSPPHSAAGRVD